MIRSSTDIGLLTEREPSKMHDHRRRPCDPTEMAERRRCGGTERSSTLTREVQIHERNAGTVGPCPRVDLARPQADT